MDRVASGMEMRNQPLQMTPIAKLISAAREAVEYLNEFTDEELLTLDTDKHPPATLTVAKDGLVAALKELDESESK